MINVNAHGVVITIDTAENNPPQEEVKKEEKKTEEAPYGYKKDGTPKKKPGAKKK